MRICILSNNNEPIGYIDNSVPKALHYYNDKLTKFLDGGAHTYEFTIANSEETDIIKAGNRISFRYQGEDFCLIIMKIERSEKEIKVVSYSLSFELLNETALPISLQSKSFVEYLEAHRFEMNDLEIGINVVSDKRISHEWESSSDTILARIYSIAKAFDAEVEFVTRLNPNYSLDKIVMNVYREHSDTSQGIGQRRTDQVYRYGVNISSVKITEDATEIYTAIRPYGADGLNISSIGLREVRDTDGALLYSHPQGDYTIFAPQARDRFPAHSKGGEGRYILYIWETEYTSVEELYGNALSKLKELSNPKNMYETDGYVDANIGDVITIVDDSYTPTLRLECRVIKQEISTTGSSKNRTTFATIGMSYNSRSTLFTKNGSVYISNDNGSYDKLSDYVIEQGTSTTEGRDAIFSEGRITFQKWASGKLEQWGWAKTSGEVNVNTASWFSGYESPLLTAWGRWMRTFTGVPQVSYRVASSTLSGDYLIIERPETQDYAESYSPHFKIIRGTSKNEGLLTISFHAVGRWR